MWIYDPDRTCHNCGFIDTVFFAQKQRKNQIAISNKCQTCKAIDRSFYYYKKEKMRRYLKDKNNMYAQEKI